LSRSERDRVAGLLAAILALNAAGWSLFAVAILPNHFHYAGLGLGLGVAFTAWTLGCRHAFDADHIAAIDNCTRKLIADGKRPLATGFCFALGHSAVIMLVGVGITFAAKPVLHAVVRPTSLFQTAGGVAGTVASATFLWLIAALNLVVLAGIVRVLRELRRGRDSEEELEARLQSRGLMWRFFRRWTGTINHSWQLVPLGFVFGIGFDTATEVLLLSGAAAAATQGLPWYAVLVLPLLFAGGVTLFDTFDGLFMSGAYRWAFARPVRRVYYNLTITALSVAVALLIGGIELGGVLSSELNVHGWLADAIANIDLNTAGFIIVGLFLAVWVVSGAVWKLGNFEARWERRLARGGAPQAESAHR
jgi:high-affinity nickel-transport protein